jgi:stalled ribosome rescue protein Dom34
MSPRHVAVLWIDHQAAEVFRLDASEQAKLVVNSHTSLQSLHRQNGHDGREPAPDDKSFFARVAATLNHLGGILLTGPGDARYALLRYLRAARPDIAARSETMETVLHPGDATLIAIGRAHFGLDVRRSP